MRMRPRWNHWSTPLVLMASMGCVMLTVVVIWAKRPSAQAESEVNDARLSVPGLHFELHVIERPGACVYLYANGYGVGMAAVAKPVLGC